MDGGKCVHVCTCSCPLFLPSSLAVLLKACWHVVSGRNTVTCAPVGIGLHKCMHVPCGEAVVLELCYVHIHTVCDRDTLPCLA